MAATEVDVIIPLAALLDISILLQGPNIEKAIAH
jgi:hypothetical protein